jgi:hypothetical protein
MHDLEIQEEKQAMMSEYMALNKMIGHLLLVENNTPEQADDIAYYTRKLTEARLRNRKEMRPATRSKQ